MFRNNFSPRRKTGSISDQMNGNYRIFTDLMLMVFIYLFLLSYFQPYYLFSKTITTGGDTASHYYTAQYLAEYLLTRGKISGWCQGNLAGFPMLQNYFPLPFILIAVLSWIIPLQIAFKIVTALGVFLLPPCTYLFFRYLKQPFPVPIIGAILTLPFLFIESHSMWGGNIPSTLAGTFCYSLGFALLILWLGLLYDAMSSGKGSIKCALILAAVGLCHGYTLLLAVAASAFFLFPLSRFGLNLKNLLYIHLAAFLFMAFWLIPLLTFLPHTTKYSILWSFSGWKHFLRDVFPLIGYPFFGLILVGTALVIPLSKKKTTTVSLRPWSYIWFIAGCGLALYAIGTRIGVVDIRFLPLFQFCLIIGAGLVFGHWPVPERAKIILAGLFFFLTLLWVDGRETYIQEWVRWNYSGFERKPLWNTFQKTNQFLQGSPQSPRVVYEHSSIHDKAGTVRAFESLPLFSGRSTLEGVYFQASLCAPFIFYLQSEISQSPSMPFHEYNYARFNLKRAAAHFKLFNVSHFVTVDPQTQKKAKILPELKLGFRSFPYEVYELVTNTNRYVVPLQYKPVLTKFKDWRRLAYRWYRVGDLAVPLVFVTNPAREDSERFLILDQVDVKKMPRIPLQTATDLKEVVKEEEILIENAPVGKPLLIKISYHPNWKVEGAEKIYLVSPAFMLIYPNASRVRLYYGRTWPNYIGGLLTILAIGFILFMRPIHRQRMDHISSRIFTPLGKKTALGIFFIVVFSATPVLLFLAPVDPVRAYDKGLKDFSRKDYQTAARHFKNVFEKHPQTTAADQAGYYYGMCFFLQQDWENTIRSLQWLLEVYPETRRAAESFYHIGLSFLNLKKSSPARDYFLRTAEIFPDEVWATYARERLDEIPSD